MVSITIQIFCLKDKCNSLQIKIKLLACLFKAVKWSENVSHHHHDDNEVSCKDLFVKEYRWN